MNVCYSETHLELHGVINKHLVQDFNERVKEYPYEKNFVVHFNTPGGSVLDGMQLLPFFEKNNVVCIVSKAYSMGFVLLQACQVRKIEKYGSIMMHDMQMAFNHIEFSKLQSYLNFLSKIYEDLLLMQIKKIGISRENFLNKIRSDWWMDAKDALVHHCVDEII